MYQVCVYNKLGRNIGVVFESDSYRECKEYITEQMEICGEVDLRIIPDEEGIYG